MSNLISFRLSSSEMELLKTQQYSDESLSLCAARLLRRALGLTDDNSDVNISETALTELISHIIDAREQVYKDSLIEFRDELCTKVINPLIEKVDALEKQVNKPKTSRTKKASSTGNQQSTNS